MASSGALNFVAMLSFDLTTLGSHAVQVDGELAREDAVWSADDARPVGSVRVVGRLSSAGSGRFYFSGAVSGSVGGTCRRCLRDVASPVQEEMHVLFAPEGDAEIDDPDVFVIDRRARELDLRPAVREQWLLAAPKYVLCQENCKGLCAQCGADLNDRPCSCEPATDSRWDALRKARGTT